MRTVSARISSYPEAPKEAICWWSFPDMVVVVLSNNTSTNDFKSIVLVIVCSSNNSQTSLQERRGSRELSCCLQKKAISNEVCCHNSLIYRQHAWHVEKDGIYGALLSIIKGYIYFTTCTTMFFWGALGTERPPLSFLFTHLLLCFLVAHKKLLSR